MKRTITLFLNVFCVVRINNTKSPTANQQTPGSFDTTGNYFETIKLSVWANAVKHSEFLFSPRLLFLILGQTDPFI